MSADFSLHEKLLNKVIAQGFARTHSRGYVWFKTVFIPTLEKAASSSIVPTDILSSCYYIAGDINDVNGAPKKALTYYHSALKFEEDNSAIHREIANMLGQLGRFKEALEYSNKAIMIDPDDSHALEDRKHYLDADNIALYEEDDILWNVRENLANNEPVKALTIVEEMNDVIGLRGKLLCYGALEEGDKYLKAWAVLTQMSESIFFSSDDWFYMPEYLYDSPKIWTTFLSSKTEFSGFGELFDSLESNSIYRAFSDNDKMRLSFQYYKYTTSKNYMALKRLLKIYPEWVEIREYLFSHK